MQMTLKEFRHLAQSTQSIVTSVAVIAAVGLAWYAITTFRNTQKAALETDAESY